MGGRGSYSFSGRSGGNGYRGDAGIGSGSSPLSAYAVASLNRGTAEGTTTDAAIERFREQLMDSKTEFSAYVDDAGYVHALGSSGSEGSTSVAPFSALKNERGVSTIVHNHPFGGSDGRIWGGPLSSGDLMYVTTAHKATGGKVNRIVATSNEGTYSAVVTKAVTQRQVSAAIRRADSTVRGKKYQSEIEMWRSVNDAYTAEFAKIGVKITYTPQKKRSKKLVTQRTGAY